MMWFLCTMVGVHRVDLRAIHTPLICNHQPRYSACKCSRSPPRFPSILVHCPPKMWLPYHGKRWGWCQEVSSAFPDEWPIRLYTTCAWWSMPMMVTGKRGQGWSGNHYPLRMMRQEKCPPLIMKASLIHMLDRWHPFARGHELWLRSLNSVLSTVLLENVRQLFGERWRNYIHEWSQQPTLSVSWKEHNLEWNINYVLQYYNYIDDCTPDERTWPTNKGVRDMDR